MNKLNEQIRKDFPILNEKVNGAPLIYFDNGATTQKPQAVIDAVTHFYQSENANVYRSVHSLSARATAAYEESRQLVQKFIGAARPEEIIFTSGTTDATNKIAYGFVCPLLSARDEIVITALEHHSNLVPWQMLAQATGAKLRYVELSDEGTITLEAFKKVLSKRTKMVAISHVSNVLGTIQPLKVMIQLAHDAGAYVLVDGAQAVAHQIVNVCQLDADFYVFSGHKMYGPTGIGVLYGKKELLEVMRPTVYGGEMIAKVTDQCSTWAELPHKLEAGTPNIAGAVGLGEAIKYLNSHDFEKLLAHEKAVYDYAFEKLQKMSQVTVYGPPHTKQRTSVISFNVRDIHPHDLATALDTQGIAIRAGHHCAQPLMRRLQQLATARISLAIYNTQAEVDQFIDVLEKVEEFFMNGF